MNESKATSPEWYTRGKHMGIAVLDQGDGLALPTLVLTMSAIDIPEKRARKQQKMEKSL